MARIVKTRKRRKIKFSGMVSLVFTFALLFYFVSAIFVRAENARMVRDIEQTKVQMAQLRAENQELARDINKLSDYSYVVKVAENAGLAFNTSNRFYISHGD